MPNSKPWTHSLANQCRYALHPCHKCGFRPEHHCQMDVDHIDGDKSNNHETNLQVLCANCHRLKTHVFNDVWRHRNKVASEYIPSPTQQTLVKLHKKQ